MLEYLPPGSVLVLGALLVPLLRGVPRQTWLLALPLLSFAHLLSLGDGSYGHIELFDVTLTVTRIDKLSLVWGYIFHIAAFLSALYAIHVKDSLQPVAGMMYAGAAIAGAFAGDLITLFVCWELTAVSSVFLIWASRTERAYRAGMRYLIIQVGSGVLLLSGVLIHYGNTGSLAFHHLGDLSFTDNMGPTLIFLAFGMKCAFPFMHNWLQDAYPEATATGTVFLSAFTTKLAVYALARGFAGTDILVPIGAVMTVFPVFYAVLENDLRRVLAYSLNNQLGFMVVGVGIGSEMAINGAASHAFAHILYKALLFMSMGAILHRVGTVKATELGMLYRSMPWTTFFCIIGALSISAFPLFSGFVTKSMTLTAAAESGYDVAFFVLLFASAGVLHHSGIKIPFYGFFGHHDSGIRVKEAPWNMLFAKGITAFLCVAIGVYPQPLYNILPYPVDFEPYTASHVITQLQLLVFALLAFVILAFKHLEAPELRCTNVDSDVVYRKFLPWVVSGIGQVCASVRDAVIGGGKAAASFVVAVAHFATGPSGVASRTVLTSTAVLLVLSMLLILLLANHLNS
jgi:multicomponent Na+:H+ antiporter subunit D